MQETYREQNFIAENITAYMMIFVSERLYMGNYTFPEKNCDTSVKMPDANFMTAQHSTYTKGDNRRVNKSVKRSACRAFGVLRDRV